MVERRSLEPANNLRRPCIEIETFSEFTMKIYGYTISDSKKLEELKEVSFLASPSELVAIADFFVKKAAEFERDKTLDHVHFSDFIGDREAENEIILCNPAIF
jgi:hypothetical protein